MKKYNSYKDSEIEWLGNKPSHWNNYRIDWITEFLRGNTGLKKDELLEVGKYVALQYGKTYKVDEVDNTFNFYVNSEYYKRNQTVKRGDIILISTSETIEDLGHSCFYNREEIGLLGGEQILLKPKTKIINEKYLYYFSKVFCGELRKYATGLKVFRFNTDDLKKVFIAIPSPEEQIAIAQYLDAKTQAIDKKINLLNKKAETYKELRKSIINDAVCKGLDKNVKLKESGIYYINPIPVHWKTERIKDQFYIGRGRVIGQETLVEEGKYPVYSSQTENNGCLGFIDTYNFDKDLLTWTTDGVNAGTVFRRSGKFNCTNVCGTLIPKRKNLDLNYVVYALQESAKHNKRIDTNGAKIMNNEMAIIHVAFPPKEEQTAIANYLDKKTQKIDVIVSNIGKQIDTLKELRKTLINDVVTGKIKITPN